jgi:hypothetical protein
LLKQMAVGAANLDAVEACFKRRSLCQKLSHSSHSLRSCSSRAGVEVDAGRD